MRRAQECDELDDRQRDQFQAGVELLESKTAQRTSRYHSQFAELYRSVDPDTDCKEPDDLKSRDDSSSDTIVSEVSEEASEDDLALAETSPEQEINDPIEEERLKRTDELLHLCDQILTDAAYERLTQEDIEKCVGIASPWGVPMSANFGVFHRLAVYARGDIIGKRYKRRLRKLYKNEIVDVAIYQRLVVLFQLAEDHERGELLSADQFHLRIFKNIPKQDVDMLLPGTKVRLSKFDRAKVIVPSIGGWLFSLQKISRFVLVTLALAAYYSTALVIGLVLAGIGYAVKSFLSYFQTRNRYLLDLTRNLYFQKLDTNSGAGFQIIQQAGRQLTCESILAYYAILSSGEPISRRRLRRKCERILREAIEVEVEFRVDQAAQSLLDSGRITETHDEKLIAT